MVSPSDTSRLERVKLRPNVLVEEWVGESRSVHDVSLSLYKQWLEMARFGVEAPRTSTGTMQR
jgi:hypothetical protein